MRVNSKGLVVSTCRLLLENVCYSEIAATQLQNKCLRMSPARSGVFAPAFSAASRRNISWSPRQWFDVLIDHFSRFHAVRRRFCSALTSQQPASGGVFQPRATTSAAVEESVRETQRPYVASGFVRANRGHNGARYGRRARFIKFISAAGVKHGACKPPFYARRISR